MKLVAWLGAGVLALGSIAAVPAEAQRGYDRDGGGWRDGGGRDRGYRQHRGRADIGRGYGYGRPRGYARSRVVCRVHRGYYGPVRRCVRVRR